MKLRLYLFLLSFQNKIFFITRLMPAGTKSAITNIFVDNVYLSRNGSFITGTLELIFRKLPNATTPCPQQSP